MNEVEHKENIERIITLLRDGVQISDTEILTVLLQDVSPVVKSEDVAKKLILKYNSLAEICSLPYTVLCSTEGVAEKGAVLLKLLELSVVSIVKERNRSDLKDVATESGAVSVLKPYFSCLDVEVFYIMFMNKSRKLIDIVEMSRGTDSGVVFDKRRIIELVIKYRASSVIFAHNHFVSTIPSVNDVMSTKDIIPVLRALDVEFCDHYIFCGNDYSSMRRSGHLKELLI